MANHASAAGKNQQVSHKILLSKTDSLEKISRDTAITFLLSVLEDTGDQEQKQIVYNRLAKLYERSGMKSKAEKAFKKAVNLADSQKDKYRQIFELAYFYNKVERYDTAKVLYEQLIEYYSKKEDSTNLGMVLSSYGSALDADGQREEALKTYYKAIQLLENTEKYLNLGASYENIAFINSELGYEKRTIKNYLNAIKAYKKLSERNNLAAAYANLGVSFKRIEQFDSALYYYHKSNEIANELNDKQLLAQNALNMGNVLSEKGDSLKAEKMYRKSLEIAQSNNLIYGQYVNYVNLGQWYYDANLYEKAINFLTKSKKLAENYNFPDQDILYNTLAKSYERLNNYKAAYQIMRMLNAYQDSVYKNKKHKELMELETKYETQKKEADILRLQKERKQEQLKNTIIIIVAIFLILILAGVLIWNYQKRKILAQKAMLASKEKEKAQKELELQNNELIASSLHVAQLKDFSQEISDRIKALKPTVKKQTHTELENILELLNQKINDEQVWQDFDRRFKELNKPFINKLINDCPDLTQAELRICMLLYLNLTSKEIAQMTNRSLRTVENLRYRIRNKLKIDKDINLVTYLHQL
ncbi:MAG: tetratricopeptide repeat protein [Bacteroidales bacterium]|nr:tetratricopeptide repeat protein [Bacteroidales bacterium]